MFLGSVKKEDMPLFRNDKREQEKSIQEVVTELKTKQDEIVQIIEAGDRHRSEKRTSDVLSELEGFARKLETILQRLDGVADTLVMNAEDDERASKPWYVRIFCP